jgi:uncharacterized protein (DUF1330 family)
MILLAKWSGICEWFVSEKLMEGRRKMPKGYWIARVDVKDAEGYKGYVAAAKAPFEKYGAKFLARGGAFQKLEGQVRARNVVIEFPSLQAAIDCYNSPEYQIAAAIRQKVANAEMVVVEGI